jgi:hypothetical protein
MQMVISSKRQRNRMLFKHGMSHDSEIEPLEIPLVRQRPGKTTRRISMDDGRATLMPEMPGAPSQAIFSPTASIAAVSVPPTFPRIGQRWHCPRHSPGACRDHRPDHSEITRPSVASKWQFPSDFDPLQNPTALSEVGGFLAATKRTAWRAASCLLDGCPDGHFAPSPSVVIDRHSNLSRVFWAEVWHGRHPFRSDRLHSRQRPIEPVKSRIYPFSTPEVEREIDSRVLRDPVIFQ